MPARHRSTPGHALSTAVQGFLVVVSLAMWLLPAALAVAAPMAVRVVDTTVQDQRACGQALAQVQGRFMSSVADVTRTGRFDNGTFAALDEAVGRFLGQSRVALGLEVIAGCDTSLLGDFRDYVDAVAAERSLFGAHPDLPAGATPATLEEPDASALLAWMVAFEARDELARQAWAAVTVRLDRLGIAHS